MSHPELRPYPIDPRTLLHTLSGYTGIHFNALSDMIASSPCHPTIIAQSALVCWNTYRVQRKEEQRETFLAYACWLLKHEVQMKNGASGWFIPYARSEYYAPQHHLSAVTQSCVISVLVRAYQLTSEEVFLQAARRAVHMFELDILDGGVSASLYDDGLFFEEIAVYPAAHMLSGHLLALCGLYDYVACTQEKCLDTLIQRGLVTLHSLFERFDTGYWTRDHLLYRHLASRRSHALHITLLEALARFSGCAHCAALAQRWAGYQSRISSRVASWLAGRREAPSHLTLKTAVRRLIFGAPVASEPDAPERVCVPIPQFPISGGMRSVLVGIAQTMREQWQMVYLTNYKGQDAAELEIETFGNSFTRTWQFPNVWLYTLAGFTKIVTFLRRNPNCRLILPQDGISTGAFAALAGKLAGARVVSIDHGNIPTLFHPALRQEQVRDLQAYPWQKRLISQLRFACYWPSLLLLARICAHFTDLYLLAGDETAEVCRQHLHVHPSRIIRYDFLVDMARFPQLDTASRTQRRAEQAMPEGAILITMINRLAIEKGLDTALAGIAQAISALPPEVQARVRVLIAGDGPLRAQVQADIQRYKLDETCILWGDANAAEVAMLLSISDIFLYTGTRGVNSMAVLEAMAAGCAVVASLVPTSNARLLAEGRGLAIPSSDASAFATALMSLCNDEDARRQMGELARDYVATKHTAEMLRRAIWRATFFAPEIRSF